MFNRVEVGPHTKTGCKPGEILLLRRGILTAFLTFGEAFCPPFNLLKRHFVHLLNFLRGILFTFKNFRETVCPHFKLIARHFVHLSTFLRGILFRFLTFGEAFCLPFKLLERHCPFKMKYIILEM